VSVIYCHTLVSPGIGAHMHTFLFFKVLITLDLPTFGYPTSPTLIDFFPTKILPYCFKTFIKAIFPYGLLILD